MANKKVRLKDSFNNHLYPVTLASYLLDDDGDPTVAITDDNKGSKVVTRIKMNGGYVGTTGEIDLGTVVQTLPTVDQTFNGSSANAQSGVAINGKLGSYQEKLNYTPENTANKSSSISDSTTQYPTSKAVKDFVNSSIATATGTFQGTYDIVADLGLQYGAEKTAIATALASAITGETINDYCFAIDKDIHNVVIYHRFKYTGTAWSYEYSLNNSSFTDAQWNAINSGINSIKVASYETVKSAWDTFNSKGSYAFTNIEDIGEYVDDAEGEAKSYADDLVAGYVPTSRTVNGQALSSNIILSASDVGALSSSTTYVASVNGSTGAITGIATTTQLNAKQDKLTAGAGIQINSSNEISVVNGVYFEEI